MVKQKGIALSKSKGFTLLELLIVVGIIGILISIATISYSSIQKKTRDIKRKDDLNTLQKEFEMYYQTKGSYPTGIGATACFASLVATITTAVKPVDPYTGSDYTWHACTAQSYCLCTGVLDVPKGNASDASCTFVASEGTNYCVRNIQTFDLP